MNKKIISSIISLVLMVSLFPLSAKAASGSLIGVKLAVSVGVNIYINDVPFTPTDVNGNEVKPFILSGTTYLPARAISNVFGAKIDWNGDTQSVYIDTSTVGAVTNNTPYRFDTVQTDTTLSAEKGVKIYVNNVLFTPTDVNGKAVAAYTVNGTTYLPVRAIASVFKTAIMWESSNSGVYIGTHTAIEEQGPFVYSTNIPSEITDYCNKVYKYYTLLQPKDAEMEARCDATMDVANYGNISCDNFCLKYGSENVDNICKNEIEAFVKLDRELSAKSMQFNFYETCPAALKGYKMDYDKALVGTYTFNKAYMSSIKERADALEYYYTNYDTMIGYLSDSSLAIYRQQMDNIFAVMRQKLANVKA